MFFQGRGWMSRFLSPFQFCDSGPKNQAMSRERPGDIVLVSCPALPPPPALSQELGREPHASTNSAFRAVGLKETFK